MKKLLINLIASLLTFSALAEDLPSAFIRGSMDIKFNSKTQPVKGVKDVYTLNVNVNNSSIFRGTITHLPLILDVGYISTTVTQPRSLTYDVACDVINPKNPQQTKNVGRVHGSVPIDQLGVYRYADGDLVCSIFPVGTASPIDSKFNGLALGKPPALGKAQTKLQKAMLNISKQVNGKTVSVKVKNYDKMVFQQHVIAAGPVQIYQEVTVNGEMVYDYDRYAWYFNGVTIQYPVNGTLKQDHLTGDIRWVEAPDRKTSGLGQYDFDIRVNEPSPGEAQAFAGPSDESAFFTQDSSIPALTGTMVYKDIMNVNGDTTSSAVAIDLHGNQLTKQQVMVLCKLIIFSAVIPMNSD